MSTPIPVAAGRVLLVEGKGGLARCVRASLRAGGYAVEVVTTAAEARRRLDTGRYDALLVDTSLPGREGLLPGRGSAPGPQ